MNKKLLIAFAAFLLITACEKPSDRIAEYTVPTGKGSYPVSSNTLVDLSTNKNLGTVNFTGGYTFNTELQYFSQDPVKEINLYSTVGSGARTKVLTLPYASAYSTVKKLDTLLVPYTVPTGLASGTSIKLDYEILNQNTLNLVRTVTVKLN